MLYDQPQKDMDWCGQIMTSTLLQRTTLDIYPIQRSRSCYKTATKNRWNWHIFANDCVTFTACFMGLGVGLNTMSRQRQNTDGVRCNLHLLTLELIYTL